MPTKNNNSLLTVTQVAELLQVSNRTVRNLIKRGHFPQARKIDPSRWRSSWRIPQEDVNSYKSLVEASRVI